jgi:predicted transcriptional regulator
MFSIHLLLKLRFRDEDARLIEAMKTGEASFDRGEFATSEEAWARAEQILDRQHRS